MKFLFLFTLGIMLSCQTPNNTVQSAGGTEIKDQPAMIETHVISRGNYQYVLVIKEGSNAGKYLPEATLQAEYCQDGMTVKIDAELLNKKAIVYKPGPTDIPQKDFEVPVIRVKGISGMRNED